MTTTDKHSEPKIQHGLSAIRPQRLIIILFIACFGIILLRSFVFALFMIPSESMKPTLLVGDYVLVNKLPMQWHHLFGSKKNAPILNDDSGSIPSFVENGRVVAFWRIDESSSSTEPIAFVKRVAACAGDSLMWIKSQLKKESTSVSSDVDAEMMRLLVTQNGVVPYKGQRIDLKAETIEWWRQLIESEDNRVNVSQGIVYINGNAAPDYRIKHDYFVVLGDNRDNSFDSRYFGYVRDTDLIGYVLCTYWSNGQDSAGDASHIRWNRIAHFLN